MINIFIQMSKEMWEFDEFGNLHFSKVVNDLMIRIFDLWKLKECNHDITIVFFSRTYYDVDPTTICDQWKKLINVDVEGQFYQDFYWLIIKNEKCIDPELIIARMISAFQNYQEIVVLQSQILESSNSWNSDAYSGNFLEMINLSLNVSEKQYIDCNFERMGQATIIITPGQGAFEVDRNLAIVTMERVNEISLVPYVICLGEPAPGILPYFKYKSPSNCQAKYGFDYSIPSWLDLSFFLCSLTDNPNVKHIPKVLKAYHRPSQSSSKRSTQDSVNKNRRFSAVRSKSLTGTRFKKINNCHHRNIESKRVFGFVMPPKLRPFFKSKGPSRSRSVIDLRELKPDLTFPQLVNPFAPDEYYEPKVITTLNAFYHKWDNAYYCSPNYSFHFYNANEVSTSQPSTFLSNTAVSPRTSFSPSTPTNADIRITDCYSKLSPFNNFDGISTFSPTPLNDMSGISSTIKCDYADQVTLPNFLLKKQRRIIFGKGGQQPNTTDEINRDGSISRVLPLILKAPFKNESDLSLTGVEASKGGSFRAHFNLKPSKKLMLYKKLWNPQLKIGIEWKVLYCPACLPLTVNFVPDVQTIKRDFIIFDYCVLPEDNSPMNRPFTAYELLEELIFQRLRFGGQLVKNMTDEAKQFFFPNTSSQYTSNLLSRLIDARLSQKTTEYVICIGRSYHLLSLTPSPSNTINVTIYKPRHSVQNDFFHNRIHLSPPINRGDVLNDKTSSSYIYHLRSAEDEIFRLRYTSFRFERTLDNFMWNTLDTYIAGGSTSSMFPPPLTYLFSKPLTTSSSSYNNSAVSLKSERLKASLLTVLLPLMNKIRWFNHVRFLVLPQIDTRNKPPLPLPLPPPPPPPNSTMANENPKHISQIQYTGDPINSSFYSLPNRSLLNDNFLRFVLNLNGIKKSSVLESVRQDISYPCPSLLPSSSSSNNLVPTTIDYERIAKNICEKGDLIQVVHLMLDNSNRRTQKSAMNLNPFYVSCEIANWILKNVEGLHTLHEACNVCQSLLDLSLMRSLTPMNNEFVYGTYLYNFPTMNTPVKPCSNTSDCVKATSKSQQHVTEALETDHFFEIKFPIDSDEIGYEDLKLRKHIVYAQKNIFISKYDKSLLTTTNSSSDKQRAPPFAFFPPAPSSNTVPVARQHSQQSHEDTADEGSSNDNIPASILLQDDEDSSCRNATAAKLTTVNPQQHMEASKKIVNATNNPLLERVNIHYMSAYAGLDCYAYELTIEWLSATPNALMDNLVARNWRKCANRLGFHLFPVLMDPFYYSRSSGVTTNNNNGTDREELVDLSDQDPLRLPVFLPLNDAFVRKFTGDIFQSDSDTLQQRPQIGLLKEKFDEFLDWLVRDTFDYVRHIPSFISPNLNHRTNENDADQMSTKITSWRINQELNNLGGNNTGPALNLIGGYISLGREYVHHTGGMFIALEIQTTTKSIIDVPHILVGYRWSWNFLLTKKWRLPNYTDELVLEQAFDTFKSRMGSSEFLEERYEAYRHAFP